jgi:hypothetical protein
VKKYKLYVAFVAGLLAGVGALEVHSTFSDIDAKLNQLNVRVRAIETFLSAASQQ